MKRRMIWVVIAATVTLVAGTMAGPALSQDAGAVPTAKQVVDRFIKALGGEAAIRAHTVRVMQGTMEMPGQGMSAEMLVKSMAPDKMRMDMTIPGMGKIEAGFDGEVAWAMNPMAGPMIQEGKELAQTKRQADFFSDLHGENLFKSMTNSGQADFEGKPCWKVELVTPEGETVVEYFNVETGLVDGSTLTQESPMGPLTITTVISEYKEFGGVLSPTKMIAKIGPGMEQVMTIQSIGYEGVTAADFALPAAIQTLAAGGEVEAEVMPEEEELPEPANLERVD